MKPIKLSELKEGDWFCNDGIYVYSRNKKNTLSMYRSYAFVKEIDGKNIRIKCWGIQEGEVIDRNILDKNEELFSLDEKEVGEIRKLLIIHSLQN